MSLSSPPQSPIMTPDEPGSHSTKSPLHNCPDSSPEQTTSYPDSTSTSQLPASPSLPVSSSRSSNVNTSTSMSVIYSRIQPSHLSQNLTTETISNDSNLSCLTLPEPTTSLRRAQLVELSSQLHDSGIVDPAFVSMKPQQSITPSFSFPGACTPATLYDQAFRFPDSLNSHCASTMTSSIESISATSQKMPNVYINGLPPHCSEQDLFALARTFGDIKSVRTFTRHVSEKPTGYGFVLFYDTESAQRCIEGLRQFRNLHPSFSKQVHRIPGTEYAKHNPAQSTDQDENSFKSRMEKLKDDASTNLYIEGLPLSTDEESLTALMSPYKIKSSRFFKTKLSNPPRIIAFVRLETRSAAEDIIERLHGRMVRGWNDPGCRISVRFADSAEQRELRRTERTSKNGDQSPSRLTIAQAALLNLRGQELQANIRDATGTESQRAVNLYANQASAFTSIPDSAVFPTSRSLPSKLCYPLKGSPLSPTSELPITSEMDNLLQSIHNMGYDDGSLDSTMRNSALDSEYPITQQAKLRALANAAMLPSNPPPITMPRGHTQARNGFTPAEELILEAHAQRLQMQGQIPHSSPTFEPMSLPKKLNSSARSFDPAPHERLRAPGIPRRERSSQEALPTISEDDFHAMGHPSRRFVPTSHEPQGPLTGYLPGVGATSANTLIVRPPNRAVSIVAPPSDYEEPGKGQKGHLQRTERSVGSGYSSPLRNRRSIPTSESKSHPVLTQTFTSSNDTSNGGSNSSTNTSTISRSKNKYLAHSNSQGRREEETAPHSRSLPAAQTYTKQSPQLGEQHPTVKEGPKSPAVVSPALTYSSRTPSTLSPATPFFGSFTGGQDAFEVVMMMENDDPVVERKLKAGVINK